MGVWISASRPARHTVWDMSNKVTAMRHKEQMDERVVTGLTERIGGDGGWGRGEAVIDSTDNSFCLH